MYLTLVDSALERIDQARQWLEFEAGREKRHLLTAAVRIVGELRSTLDICNGGPWAAHLDDLCEYMSRQLMAAQLGNEGATLDAVADLLREVRTVWVIALREASAPHAVLANA